MFLKAIFKEVGHSFEKKGIFMGMRGLFWKNDLPSPKLSLVGRRKKAA